MKGRKTPGEMWFNIFVFLVLMEKMEYINIVNGRPAGLNPSETS
ncbi:MAG TPA: hypothetical protein VHY08_08455 [Bacillota bacterium]|nr:hypothetical protein [Bacillota bacterium]